MNSTQKLKRLLLSIIGGSLGGVLICGLAIYYLPLNTEWLWYGLSIGGVLGGLVTLISLFFDIWVSAFLAGALVGVVFFAYIFRTGNWSFLLIGVSIGMLVGGLSSLCISLFFQKGVDFKGSLVIGAGVSAPLLFCGLWLTVFLYGAG